MKRNVKIFCAALALVLVFGVVVGGTLAWLMDTTESVTNTFTVGNVDITLEETAMTAVTDEDNNITGYTNDFKMIPGNTITKDPKVTVEAGSEACWLFVRVDKLNDPDTYLEYDIDSAWTSLTGEDGVYYIKQADLSADGASDAVYNILTDNKVTVKTTVTKTDMDALETSGAFPKLRFTAHAIQMANFEAEIAEGATAEEIAAANAAAAAKAWEELTTPMNG